ncbi:MAG: hypothetical protein ACKOE2_08170, partial [Actinomycetales bacterium]
MSGIASRKYPSIGTATGSLDFLILEHGRKSTDDNVVDTFFVEDSQDLPRKKVLLSSTGHRNSAARVAAG